MFCREQRRYWRLGSSLPAWSCRGGQVFSATPPRSSIPALQRANRHPRERRNRRNRAKRARVAKPADCSMSCRRVSRCCRRARGRRRDSSGPQRRLDRKSRNRDRRKLSWMARRSLRRWSGLPWKGIQPRLEVAVKNMAATHWEYVSFWRSCQVFALGAPAMPEKRSSNRTSRAMG